MVWAQQWLRGRSGAPGGTREPHEVWSSCDGSLVASRGAWRRDGVAGRFVTIWQRQPDGAYRWLLEEGSATAQVPPSPDMIQAHVADCPERPGREALPPRGEGGKPPKPAKAKAIKPSALPPLDPAGRSGKAADGTLDWAVSIGADGARRLVVRWRHDGAEETILEDTGRG